MKRIQKKIYKKQSLDPKPKSKVKLTRVHSYLHMHTFMQRVLQRKWSAILFLIVFCMSVALITAGTILFIFIKTNEDFAANFADDVLRPMIGNTSTISLEAMFFGVEDKVNQIKYRPNSSAKTYAQLVPPKSIAEIIPTQKVEEPFTLHPIQPVIKNDVLPQEGIWVPLVTSNAGNLIEKTDFRPDPNRPYAVTTLVAMNMKYLKIGMVAGTQQPGGPRMPGPGKVPQEIQMSNNLIASFNGGFQQKDGYYGMIVGGTTYLPLEKGMATLLVAKDAPPKIIKYNGQHIDTNVVSIRQNGPMLLEDGKVVTASNTWNMQTWGLTTTNSMYTWRSGLGVTKEGNLIYVCGSSLVPETLASALLAAGATDAMQLDINPFWVRYNLFTSLGNGGYNSLSLNKEMVDGGYQYLHGYQKDFFYIYKSSI